MSVQLTLIEIVAEKNPALSISESALVDVIWAAARPADAIEHISVRSDEWTIFVGLFTGSDAAAAPDRVADGLMERVREMSPLLRSWTVAGAQNVRLAYISGDKQ
jgi:hypothetical protein